MKKHRALWVIIIVIVVLAAAAAGVWFWLQSRLDETQQAHQTVYAEVSGHDGGCGSGAR